MKTITAREHELITSAIGEGLTALPEGVVDELVFGEPITFVEARAAFVGLAERLLSHKALAEMSIAK